MTTPMPLLPLHILAGATAIMVGFVALFARKGAHLHRRSGTIFVYAMLTMAGSGAVMAALQPNRGNVMGGLLTLYMVTTAHLTTRRSVENIKWMDSGALLLGLAASTAGLTFGLSAMRNATGRLDGYPAPLYFIFAGVAFLASLGDVKMFFQGIHGKRRIARHLWRMCLAMFIATASFFLGQTKVMPKPMRIMPLLAIPVLVVLIVMFYWLARVRFGRPRLLLVSPPALDRTALESSH
jgi:uncharacterized membrane protein